MVCLACFLELCQVHEAQIYHLEGKEDLCDWSILVAADVEDEDKDYKHYPYCAVNF